MPPKTLPVSRTMEDAIRIIESAEHLIGRSFETEKSGPIRLREVLAIPFPEHAVGKLLGLIIEENKIFLEKNKDTFDSSIPWHVFAKFTLRSGDEISIPIEPLLSGDKDFFSPYEN